MTDLMTRIFATCDRVARGGTFAEPPYIVLNGDGIMVGEYETVDHANEAARDMARAARAGGDTTNFYSTADREGNAVEGGEEHHA